MACAAKPCNAWVHVCINFTADSDQIMDGCINMQAHGHFDHDLAW